MCPYANPWDGKTYCHRPDLYGKIDESKKCFMSDKMDKCLYNKKDKKCK